jgi:hypothetical protein
VVGLQVLGDLAHQAQRDRAGHGGDRGAAAAEILVGAGAQRAVDDHLVDERDALADLLDHRLRDVVFVEVVGLVGEAVEAAVLLHHHRDVERHDAVRRRRDAFLDLVGLDDHVAAVAGAVLEELVLGRGAGRGRAIGQPAAGDVGVGVVLRHRDLAPGAAEHFQRHGVLENLALELVPRWRCRAGL